MSASALIPMATVLAAEVIELKNERHCINVLIAHRFDRLDIMMWLPDAQEIAREMRATIGEISLAKLDQHESPSA